MLAVSFALSTAFTAPLSVRPSSCVVTMQQGYPPQQGGYVPPGGIQPGFGDAPQEGTRDGAPPAYGGNPNDPNGFQGAQSFGDYLRNKQGGGNPAPPPQQYPDGQFPPQQGFPGGQEGTRDGAAPAW